MLAEGDGASSCQSWDDWPPSLSAMSGGMSNLIVSAKERRIRWFGNWRVQGREDKMTEIRHSNALARPNIPSPIEFVTKYESPPEIQREGVVDIDEE